MFFKNFQIFRMLKAWPFTAEQLEQRLTKFAFAEAMSTQVENMGWVPPRKNGTLVHTVNRQYLLSLCFEKKLLPPSVVNQVVRARAEEIEEQQGFKPGRRQMKELKETVTDELLPRAFSINSTVGVWIDPINGWLAVNTGSASRREAVFKMLLKALDTLPVEALRAERSPLSAMTDWLASDEVPAGFTVDQETELRATNEGKATVRYVRHTLEADDVRRHIAAGKRCTRLAMTWSDRISFVLNEDLVLKRVAPLDVLKEPAGTDTKNAEELFDSEFAMMSGEMARLLKDLTGALGGVRTADSELVQ